MDELKALEDAVAVSVWSVTSSAPTRAQMDRLEALRRATGMTWDAVNRCWRPWTEVE